MVDYKLVINDPKNGKSFAKEVKEQNAEPFVNKKIGDTVAGDAAGFAGYEFKITGGSDNCGFPMRKDVESARKKILCVGGVGLKDTAYGVRKRKTVCGNRITAKIAQINLTITKHGKDTLGGEAAEAKEA
jgi:small subunit ribosomal protein S6e